MNKVCPLMVMVNIETYKKLQWQPHPTEWDNGHSWQMESILEIYFSHCRSRRTHTAWTKYNEENGALHKAPKSLN